MLMLLVWLGVFASLILFCWELAWKMQQVRVPSSRSAWLSHLMKHDPTMLAPCSNVSTAPLAVFSSMCLGWPWGHLSQACDSASALYPKQDRDMSASEASSLDAAPA